MHPNLITISGPPGSGTSTTVNNILDEHTYEYLDAGTIFRNLASERNLSLAEFSKLCETDETIDKSLDRRIRTEITSKDPNTPLLVESRLAGWIALDQPALSIWLDAPPEVRLDRGIGREAETLTEMQERERSEAQRYREYYDINFSDTSIYDITLNTALWDPNTIQTILNAAIKNYTPEAPPTTQSSFSPTVFE